MKLVHLIPWLPGFLLILLGLGEAVAEERPPMTDWATVYTLEDEHKIAKNSLLTTIPNMAKEWKVAFDVMPTDYSFSGYASVLHLTIGGKGVGSSAKVGDRTPAIWFHKTRGVMVSSALDGKASYNKLSKNLPLAGEWIRIEVSQILISSQYMYSVTIGDNQVFAKPNTKPVELSGVKVYSGSPWYSGQKGLLRNLKIEMKIPIEGPTSGCINAGNSHFHFYVAHQNFRLLNSF